MQDDSKSVQELFAEALRGAEDDEAAWSAVIALHLRGTAEVLRMALDHCRSSNAKERARGLDVLSQLQGDAETAQTCIDMAIAAIDDPAPEVRRSAAWALSHRLPDARVEETLVALKGSPDPDIRWAVASGLMMATSQAAEETLIKLTRDDNDNVRDWATFSLGHGEYPSSLELLHALRERLNDRYKDARDEALWGLARRKDPNALAELIQRLEADTWVSGDETAAKDALEIHGEVTNAELCAGLRALLSKLSPST